MCQSRCGPPSRALFYIAFYVCCSHFSHSCADSPTEFHSLLWGQNGDLWQADSRLTDFSYAGYLRGEQPIPSQPPQVSVRDFGAVGDGRTDDTAAFRDCIRNSPGKVISVPAGTYLIVDTLVLDQSGTVLQGAGPDKSRLKFTIPLNDIQPNWGATTTGKRTSNYSWSGGFVMVRGTMNEEVLARVTHDAQRGQQQLIMSDVADLKLGQSINLHMQDTDDQSLAKYLYQGDPGPIENLGARTKVQWAAKVTSIDLAAKTITLDRHLTTDVRLEWSPALSELRSTVQEAGVEGLGFEFPQQPYLGHFTELGFNAIGLSGVRNCWIRDVTIHNCDSGIFISGIQNSVIGVRFTSSRQPEQTRQATGHHGVSLGGQDNLLSEFEFATRFMHDITVSRGSSGNVAMKGHAVDLCFDHHRYAPFANLFTDIDIGLGSRMFQSGGGAALGRHSAAWTTFWGIQSEQPIAWPKDWSPDEINLVGIHSREPTVTDSNQNGRWLEAVPPQKLLPLNLYRAQLQRRIN